MKNIHSFLCIMAAWFVMVPVQFLLLEVAPFLPSFNQFPLCTEKYISKIPSFESVSNQNRIRLKEKKKKSNFALKAKSPQNWDLTLGKSFSFLPPQLCTLIRKETVIKGIFNLAKNNSDRQQAVLLGTLQTLVKLKTCWSLPVTLSEYLPPAQRAQGACHPATPPAKRKCVRWNLTTTASLEGTEFSVQTGWTHCWES